LADAVHYREADTSRSPMDARKVEELYGFQVSGVAGVGLRNAKETPERCDLALMS